MAELTLTSEEEAEIESVIAQLDPDHDELFADVRQYVDPEDWPAVRERVLVSLRGELMSRLAGRAVRSFIADRAAVTATEDEIRFIEDCIRTAFIYKCEAQTLGGIAMNAELRRMLEIEKRSGLPATTILDRTFNLGKLAGAIMFDDFDEELRQLTT